MVTIQRSSDDPAVNTFFAASLQELCDKVVRYSETPTETTLLVSDLSLGAWRANQAAAELLEQLGDEPEQKKQQRSANAEIGFWIDVESAGGVTIQKAIQNAESVLTLAEAPGGATIVIIAPRFGYGWGHENELFLRALAQGVKAVGSELFFVFDPTANNNYKVVPPDGIMTNLLENAHTADEEIDNDLPSDYIYRYLPGVVQPQVASALMQVGAPKTIHGLKLSNGRLLLPPEIRRPLDEVPSKLYCAPLASSKAAGWVVACWECHKRDRNTQYGVLIREAWRALQEGADDIAHKYIDRTILTAPDERSHSIFSEQRQWMRIATHRFAEAGAEADPPDAIDDKQKGTLYWQKAWGLVMSNRPEEAQPRFDKAASLLNFTEDQIENIYFLNINALCQMRLGDQEGAMKIEQEIDRLFTEGKVVNWHMRFINYLNMARLMRRENNIASAEKYYDRAYEMTRGTKSELDGFYLNASVALLQRAIGNHEKTFLAFFRSALHFVALGYPEAVGWRIVETIKVAARECGVSMVETGSSPNQMADTILAILRTLARQNGIAIEPEPKGDAPVFISIGNEELDAIDSSAKTAVGGAGWGLFVGQNGGRAPWEGKSHRRLRRVLLDLVRQFSPSLNIPDNATLLVDTSNGFGMPATKEDLMTLAIVRGAKDMLYKDEEIALGDKSVEIWKRACLLMAGPAIKEIAQTETGADVTFQRYYDPVCLDTEETLLTMWLSDRHDGAPTTTASDELSIAMPKLWEVAEKLYQQHVVQIVYAGNRD